MRYFLITLLTALLCAQVSHAGEAGISVVFSDSEVSVIRAWYREHSVSGKHKGKKHRGLPPGIAKNLQRGKPLPPGIAKQHLPPGLHDVLPAPPSGYERIVVDGKILLVEIATRVIHDILTDAILH